MTFVLKAYSVLVTGFDAHRYYGRTPGQARAAAWRSYCSYRAISFGEFLRISTIRRTAGPPDFGKPITVGGEAAYMVEREGQSQYVRFVRSGDDQIVLSHPLDVTEAA